MPSTLSRCSGSSCVTGKPSRLHGAAGSYFATSPSLCIGSMRSPMRPEEHTSALQSLMRISYAVFCLNKETSPHPSCSPPVITLNTDTVETTHHAQNIHIHTHCPPP